MPPKEGTKRKSTEGESERKINYSSGIKTIAGMVNEELSLNSKTVTFLNQLINGVNDKLIARSAQKMPATGQVDAKIAHTAVTDTLSGELRQHALAEAYRNIFNFNLGVILYQPVKKEPKQQISYFDSIESISETVNDNLKLRKSAAVMLNNLMNGVNDKLVDDCIEKMPETGKIEASIAQSAVKDKYPGELRQRASAKAQKDVYLAEHGLTTYQPGKPRSKRPKIPSAFTKVLNNLIAASIQGAKLDANGEEVIGNILQMIAKGVCDKAKEKAGKKLELDAVKSVIEREFPTEMSRHAQSEGARAILGYENRLFEFK